MDVQADLGLRSLHMPEDMFLHAVAHIISITSKLFHSIGMLSTDCFLVYCILLCPKPFSKKVGGVGGEHIAFALSVCSSVCPHTLPCIQDISESI